MNEHILIAMDWKNRSKEELKENYHASWDAYVANATLAAWDADDAEIVASWDAYHAAYAAAFAAVDIEYWVNKYFEGTGEDRQEYKKALEDMRK